MFSFFAKIMYGAIMNITFTCNCTHNSLCVLKIGQQILALSKQTPDATFHPFIFRKC